MDVIEKFEKDAKIQVIKYLVSKQMFCKYSNKVLDYRNAILIELEDAFKETQSAVIHGSFENKIPEFTKRFEELGLKVTVTKNIK